MNATVFRKSLEISIYHEFVESQLFKNQKQGERVIEIKTGIFEYHAS